MLRNLARLTCRSLSGYCLLAALAFAAHAQQLTFTTFVGPTEGPGSVDGAGAAARLSGPYGTATDSGGNVYVAEVGNSTIRKITPSGMVTTLAGMAGLRGSADGTGSAARFNGPYGVATDGGGNVYVADTNNHTIRKITPAGVVTTLAGSPGVADSTNGTGSAARFSFPEGVAADGGGNLYVVDRDKAIRKITPAGVVTTLAGSPGLSGSADGTGSAARFNLTRGVTTDRDGNVYVADNGNKTIRKITPAGVVTTLAGSAGLSGSVDGTGSAARFSGPTGVATDSAGNVYVAEFRTIRKITPAGVVTTLAGSASASGSADGTGSAARFFSPWGVATDSGDNVYVAESGLHTIRKITPAGVVTTLVGVAPPFPDHVDGTGSVARFISPRAVATDSAGNLYVADTDYNTIRKITPEGVVTTLAGSPGLSGSADGTGSAARFSSPLGVAAGSGGNVYVADRGNYTIRRITPAGVVTTLAGSPGLRGVEDGTGSNAHFIEPIGVAADSSGSVYVVDRGACTIRKITPAGVVTTFAGSAGLPGNADGAGSAARFIFPGGVATDGANVYVADTSNSTIRKITPAGVVTTLAGLPMIEGSADGTGGGASFRTPTGMATDSGGNVYVADTGNGTIRKITPTGVVTTLAGTPGLSGNEDGTGAGARFSNLAGVSTDAHGNLYVTDISRSRIRIGRPALADVATIDSATGPVGAPRQLNTSPQTATSWEWRIIRQPSGSNRALFSTSIRDPLFIPDVADLYVFELTASDEVNTSITTVSLSATEAPVIRPGPRHRAIRH